MSSWPHDSLIGAFLFALSALFSICNPISSALVFNQATSDRTREDRRALSNKIAIYALIVLLGSLLIGSYVLSFFGIGLGALRIGGGLVVAVNGWRLLAAPDEHQDRTSDHTQKMCAAADDVAFFPLTMPLTTGPGAIAVSIALGTQRPANANNLLPFFVGLSLAATCIAFSIWIAYRCSDRMLALIGPGGTRVVSRLVAFLLLCIGAQIIVTGVQSVAVQTAHMIGR
jgi:multiple antibiotic resistance protein